jgi:hypothetical protein
MLPVSEARSAAPVAYLACADERLSPWPWKGTAVIDLGHTKVRLPAGFVEPRFGTFTCPECENEGACLYRRVGTARVACRKCLRLDVAAETLTPEERVEIEVVEADAPEG